ncbi:MAG: hypothetical protein IT162_15175 [Bryobacterales bacterium]|nr:hypothetical protein [Bryobacterales bacterium]
MSLKSSACCSLLWPALLCAQPQPFVPLDGVLNGANFLPNCAPNGGVAQGAMFTVTGRDIGPAALAQVSRFPLTPSLAGVAARVRMAGADYDALPIYASATQVGALLPAAVPAGDGTLTLSYNGRASEAVPIRVRPSAPGIFTVNARGFGAASVQNIDAAGNAALNSAAHPLRPGQLATLWATGLGRAPGDETAGPIPGDRPEIETRVWVGDRYARVVYRGRSGCCAGIDQIVFETPSGVEGCQVPINIEAGGVQSNYGTVAISSTGECNATRRLPPVNGTAADFKFGLVFFLDGFGSVLLPGALDDYVRLGFFQRGATVGDVEAPLYAFETNAEAPPGTCAVRYGTDFPAQPQQPQQLGLDAGTAVNAGTFSLLQSAVNAGRYEDPRRVAIPAGRYRIDNGAGGRDVGPFGFDAELITLRLHSPGDRIARNQDLTLTWDYAGPAGHLLTIFGSTNSCGRGIISFSCVARASDRRFVVPARILSLLPPSVNFFGVSNGALNISTTAPGGLRRFTAPGLDLGLFLQLSISALRPHYE